MRVDPDTSIHDLTDTEAADLRALCEAMLRGPFSSDHPLFVTWAQAVRSSSTTPAALLSVAFLPRALHALLRRADLERTDRVLDEAQAALYAADRAKTAARKRYDKAMAERRKVLASQVKA